MNNTATALRIRDNRFVIPDAPSSDHMQEMANEAYDLADGDWSLADKIIHKWIDKNADLRLALLEKLIDQAIWDLVRKTAKARREKYFQASTEAGLKPNTRPADDTSGIALVSERNWMDFPLPGGMKLGDATKAELVIAADTYRQRALSNGQRAQWLSRIIEKMPDDKAVRDVLSNDDLERKAYEETKTPDGTKMLWHRRAQRYMEKRLLRDLWSAWRQIN